MTQPKSGLRKALNRYGGRMHGTLAEAIANKDLCPNCNGSGKVLIKNVRKRSNPLYNEPMDVKIDCPMCLGYGNIMLEKGG